jgi:hypothetical protein
VSEPKVLKARRAPPLASTGRPNERVLCGRDGCGRQIGWIERAGASPNAQRKETFVEWDGEELPFFVWDGPLPYREGTSARPRDRALGQRERDHVDT